MSESHDDGNSTEQYGTTIFALTSVSSQQNTVPESDLAGHCLLNHSVSPGEARHDPGVGRNRGFWSDDDILCSNAESSIDASTNLGQYLYHPQTGEETSTTFSKNDQIDNENTLADLSSFEYHEHEYHDKSREALKGENNQGYTDEEKTGETIESEYKSYDHTNYSDGYFDQSIDKIYERYNKSKAATSESSSAQTPTGCFDSNREINNINEDVPFYKR